SHEMDFLEAFSWLVQDELDRRPSRLLERRHALSGLPDPTGLQKFDCCYNALYREAHQLIEDITEARELGEIRKLRAQISGAELLLIDDLFLRKLPGHAGDELADVLMARYEKASTIITSNRPLEDWTRLLGDVVGGPPAPARLLHHAHL